MELIPVARKTANEYVRSVHRHHGPVTGFKFAVGLRVEGRLVGIAIAGRPVARMLDDGLTLEVTRLCTDGTRNACSALYSAIARAGKALGYRKVVTYILHTEAGSSLLASGFKCVAKVHGETWNRESRNRTDKHPVVDKTRWERELT